MSSSLVVSHLKRDILYAVNAQTFCIIYITTFIQWSIGGVFDSGFVMAWAICGPIGALIFLPLKKSTVWFLLYLVNLFITVQFDSFFAAHGQVVEAGIRKFFFIMNLGVSSTVVFIFAGYFVAKATSERRRADDLLLNTLPRDIVRVLKAGHETIADRYETCSILFCDIVGSTPLFSTLSPEDVVDWLNEVFSMFDRLVEKHGLEKIRTIGDNYMVAAGVPTPREDHAGAIVALALDMIEGLKSIPARSAKQINFRFGINSGAVVAGVIGRSKYQFDIWGDTVNVAARMEQHGQPGRVHISAATHDLIKDAFDCEPRGQIPIKGKETMATWFVTRPKGN